MEPTLIFSDEKGLFASSELPVSKIGSFSLDFLPNYQSAQSQKVEGDPVVVASCNDLVLWCASTFLQRDYYICNPYTKQWTVLPPAPQCRVEVRVGFTYEPYYYYKEDVDQSEKDRNSSTCSNTIQLNVDYKYAIVRILPPILCTTFDTSNLNVEIFSSETSKWTESINLCPPYLCFGGLHSTYPGLAYKGKLYWLHDRNFMIGLDPFSNDNYFQVINLPDKECRKISVSQKGRLRLWRGILFGDNEHRRKGLRIWELKDDDDDDKADIGAAKWCMINNPPLDKMVSENPLITEWSRSREPAAVVAFDQ